jgi:hypothetical protein
MMFIQPLGQPVPDLNRPIKHNPGIQYTIPVSVNKQFVSLHERPGEQILIR